MQKNWFTCRVKYAKITESGREEKATDSYVLDAHTYTEAEARITELMMQMVRGTFQILNIAKANYTEVVRFDDADKWFKVKVSLVSYDEESGTEKATNHFYLLTANDVMDAYTKTTEFMQGSISGFVIPSINFTKIVDVFPLSEVDDEQRARNQGLKPMSELVSVGEVNEPMVDPESGEILPA